MDKKNLKQKNKQRYLESLFKMLLMELIYKISKIMETQKTNIKKMIICKNLNKRNMKKRGFDKKNNFFHSIFKPTYFITFLQIGHYVFLSS